ncbi:MAG: hypothetical protein HY517_04320 [Candidatus Aenigmarchaeota archaeon]|nr:hypothetical protein [Candidatus Aenigmarchaeota archaeon]
MKGQGAIEYLMTYGWALLVIVVIAAALFFLGVLNPSSYTQSRCSGFQYFTYKDQKVTPTSYNLQLSNGPRDIAITTMTVLDGTATVSTATQAPASTSAGTDFLVNATLSTTKKAGDSFSYSVAITYNVVGGITDNVDRGTCTGKVS